MCASSAEALQRTNKDSDWGCSHEAANHDGSAIAAVGGHAAREVVGLGVHKAYSSARVSTSWILTLHLDS